MAEMVTLTINGLKIHAPAGTTLLEAATDANIYIPHLCSNEELAPYGACRLCMVEITQGERARLVASCIFEVTEGLEVKTNTERVLNVRRLVIELLLSRNNKHPALLKIADELGVKETRFPVEQRGCILCGQCVRTCREVVGVSAIGFSGRGITRKIATPFMESPPDCIACGSCVYVCPVQVIPMKEENGVRTIMKYDYPMQKCRKCGQYFAPKKQLEYFSKITNLPLEHFETCVDCR
ncbi:MAG: (2Fe-2S)-binding protein [Deltaproteobacteria bacterium]|nr:(2Fe-2S)-binding protein [Deltaproteobacteria bacterium]MBW2639735.1 (2Fe-2S)-binding protein [Deltaproteobacteria bacterium]MBW2679578.1 (2Fe-2S)-binding protein [Deltaproteobacteria bacterium]